MATTKATIVNSLKEAKINPADQESVISKLNKDDYDVFISDLNESADKEEFVTSWIASNGKPTVVTNASSTPTTIELEGLVLAPSLQPSLHEDGTPNYDNARIAFTLVTSTNNYRCVIGLKQAMRSIGYPKEYATDKEAAAKVFATTISGKGAFVTVDQAKAGQSYVDPEGQQQTYRFSANYVKEFAMDDSGFIASNVQFAKKRDILGNNAATLTPAAGDLLKAMLSV